MTHKSTSVSIADVFCHPRELKSGRISQSRGALDRKEQDIKIRGTFCHSATSFHIAEIIPAQNLSSLKRLKILSAQSNRITKIEGLEDLENLEDVYLSHNGIERLEGLDKNVCPFLLLYQSLSS